jgi:hypothetical protein
MSDRHTAGINMYFEDQDNRNNLDTVRIYSVPVVMEMIGDRRHKLALGDHVAVDYATKGVVNEEYAGIDGIYIVVHQDKLYLLCLPYWYYTRLNKKGAQIVHPLRKTKIVTDEVADIHRHVYTAIPMEYVRRQVVISHLCFIDKGITFPYPMDAKGPEERFKNIHKYICTESKMCIPHKRTVSVKKNKCGHPVSSCSTYDQFTWSHNPHDRRNFMYEVLDRKHGFVSGVAKIVRVTE